MQCCTIPRACGNSDLQHRQLAKLRVCLCWQSVNAHVKCCCSPEHATAPAGHAAALSTQWHQHCLLHAALAGLGWTKLGETNWRPLQLAGASYETILAAAHKDCACAAMKGLCMRQLLAMQPK